MKVLSYGPPEVVLTALTALCWHKGGSGGRSKWSFLDKVITSSKSKRHCDLLESASRCGVWPVTVSEYPWLWEEPGSGPWLSLAAPEGQIFSLAYGKVAPISNFLEQKGILLLFHYE